MVQSTYTGRQRDTGALPPAALEFMLGDGGIETALEGRLGQTLPNFEAFVLLETESGRDTLREYYRPFIELADRERQHLALDTPTWRANPDWIATVHGATGIVASEEMESQVTRINVDGVALVREFADRIAPHVPITVNGVVGPRYDEYDAAQRMTAEAAETYHAPQVRALAEAGADRITSVTTLDVAEGLGVVRAAVAARIPVIVSFVVGDDGRLAEGTTLAEAIRALDAASDAAPLGYAVNCAHPEEVLRGIDAEACETARLFGFRLNAARHSDEGEGDDPAAFAAAMTVLMDAAPSARLFGGCCGTDAPHLAAIAAILPPQTPRAQSSSFRVEG